MRIRNTAKHGCRGFSLLELTIAVFLMLFLLGIVSAVKGRILAAQGARTRIEMEAILDAARQFYLQNNRWPNNITELKTFLPNIPTNNVFGNVYNVAPNGGIFMVNTVAPYKSLNVIKNGRFVVVSDTGTANLIQLSSTIPMNTKMGRLRYEQTWIH